MCINPLLKMVPQLTAASCLRKLLHFKKTNCIFTAYFKELCLQQPVGFGLRATEEGGWILGFFLVFSLNLLTITKNRNITTPIL